MHVNVDEPPATYASIGGKVGWWRLTYERGGVSGILIRGGAKEGGVRARRRGERVKDFIIAKMT